MKRHRLRRGARRGVRPARAERRGQVDDGRDADHDGAPDIGTGRSSTATTSATEPVARPFGERGRVPGRGDRQGPSPGAATSRSTRPAGGVRASIAAGTHRRTGRRLRARRHARPAVRRYSGGQRRRLEIAARCSPNREVLFLDEPTVGLDPRIRYELLDLIAGLRAWHGNDGIADDPLPRRGRAPVRSRRDHARGPDRRPRCAGRICSPTSATKCSSSASTAIPRLRSRRCGRTESRARCVRGRLDADPARTRPLRADVRRRDRPPRPDHHRDQHVRPTLDDVYLRLTGDRLAA